MRYDDKVPTFEDFSSGAVRGEDNWAPLHGEPIYPSKELKKLATELELSTLTLWYWKRQ